MREILFRGKRVDNGEWVEGYYFKATHHWHNHGVHEDWIAVDTIQNGGYCNVRGKYAIIPETIGQFTGLTDKNGKRIFEGDIIKDCDYEYIHSVKYFGDEDYPAFDCYPDIQFCECNGLSHLVAANAAEVIGNIHDNPEWCK
jgi:uncharacterized phage protein (TIGR01671 family)